MKSSAVVFVSCLLEVGFASSCWAGPMSDYYVTGDTRVYHIRGDSVVNSWNMVQNQEYPVVVLDTVRTGSYYSGISGHEYARTGSFTGTAYPSSIPGLHHDGATDGVHNYTTSYWNIEGGIISNGTAIWRTDTDWTHPVKLFDTLNTRPSGITYDSSNGTLWVSEWGSDSHRSPAIRNYEMNGTVLFSFLTDGRYATAVAFDPTDGTLWMSGYENAGYFYQYSRTGTYMGSTYFSELAGVVTLGGEIAAIPEPGTYAMMLAGIGLLGLELWARKRQV